MAVGLLVFGPPSHAAAGGTPTLTTSLNASSITAGNTDFDSATLNGFVPGGSGGTVTYTVYTDNGCSMNPQAAGTVNVDETSGSVPISSTLPFTSVGTFYWQAVFSGDGTNAGATSDCTSEAMVVAKATPTIATQASPTTGTVGVSIATLSDTATLSGGAAPTGNVTFTLYSDAGCATPVAGVSGSGPISGSTASYSTSWTPAAAGTYYWIASYPGDNNNTGFTTTCGDSNEQIAVVAKATPTIATQASPTTGTVGVSIATLSDTATLSGGAAPTGNVTFTLYSDAGCATPVAGVSGSGPISGSTASYSTSWTPAAAGTYYWIASYPGDNNNTGFTTTCGDSNEQIAVVAKATPTLATSLHASSIPVGSTDYDTATLSGFAPGGGGGTVTYTVYSDSGCSLNARGAGTGSVDPSTGAVQNSSTLTFNTAGPYYWQAAYSGDSNNTGTSSLCSSEPLVVGMAAPTLSTTLHASSIPVGSTDYDTATLSGFVAGGGGGTVTYTVYTDSNCSLNARGAGTVNVDGTTGSVPNSSTLTFNTAGTYYWQAAYSGDGNNTGASSPCSSEPLVVTQAAPTITTQASPTAGTVGVAIAPAGDTATFVGTTTVAPTGSVTFTLYSDSTCKTAVPGVSGSGAISTTGGVSTASFSVASWTPTAAGTYHWIASYPGDTNNSAYTTGCNDSNEQIAVNMAAPTLSTTLHASSIPVGSTDYDTATLSGFVAGGGGGTVTYTVYTDSNCSLNARGAGTVNVDGTTGSVPNSSTLTFNTAGTYYWQAAYSGDGNNTGASSPCSSEPLVVTKASPTITTQASPTAGTVGVAIAPAGDTATFVGTTTVAPTGSVTFTLYSDSTLQDGGGGGERERGDQHQRRRLDGELQRGHLDADGSGDVPLDRQLPGGHQQQRPTPPDAATATSRSR